jgi:hypothetical protein
MSESSDIDLWLLYVDWSATQINKRLLALSLDELWALANDRRALDPADTASVPADLLPSQSSSVDLLQLVRRATLSIARDLKLPSFAVWKQEYARDSHPFDADITRI